MAGCLYQDSVNAGLSHTARFTYDNLKRLATASAAPFGSGTVSYSDTYNYDQYGNMTCVVRGSGYCPQVTFDSASNRIIKIGSLTAGYDAAVGGVAEIIPEVAGTFVFGHAPYTAGKANLNGGCRPGF